MKFFDCSIGECVASNRDRNIVIFGAGDNLYFLENSPLSELKDRVIFVIDNGDKESVTLWNKKIPVYKPEKLKEISSASVIITSIIYMSEMTEQLESFDLSDDFYCYFYCLLSMKENPQLSEEEKSLLYNGEQRIPKIIHSFWFSGGPKDDLYLRCIDSWHKFCPDYEIKEWNCDNYDVEKHPFLKKAISVGAWAYASDFARFDVVNEYGGIYMDMDFELLKSWDPILGHDAVFSFYSDLAIEPAVFAAIPNHPIVNDIHHLYDNVVIPDTKDAFAKYFAPRFIQEVFVKHGIKMNGHFQRIREDVILPRRFMTPMDSCLYTMDIKDETIGVHLCNVGWKAATYKFEKPAKNRKLVKELFGYEFDEIKGK